MIAVALWATPAAAYAKQAAPDSTELGRPDRTAAVAVQDLAGTWEGRFRLDSAWRLAARATARSTSGWVQFEPVGVPSAVQSGRSVHGGTFQVDFSAFGFTLATRDALGWSASADSMRAMLNPTLDRGTVELAGVFRGETVAGTWRYASDRGGAAGTFELKRVARRE